MPAARIATALLCLLAGCRGLRETPSEEFVPPLGASASVPAETAPQFSTSSPPADHPVSTDPAGVEPVTYHEPADASQPAEPVPAPTPKLPPTSPHTLDQLEELAVANNPAAAQVAARVRALRGRWVQAGLPPNPTIGYRGEEVGSMGTAGMQGGFVGQEFITGGKLDLDQTIVAQQIRQAEQEFFAIEQRVRTDVRRAYYDVLVAQRRLDLAQELLRINQQAVEASQRLLAQGEIPRVALLQTEVEAGSTRILLQRAENENQAAWRRLTSVLGVPDMQRTRLVGDLETTPILDFEEQLERIIAESPEIAAAAADVARAQWVVERAYAAVIPDLNAQGAVMYNNASGDTVAGVQFSLPLPLWNRNQGGIQEARQQVIAAQRNVARAELSLRERLAVAFQQYADARYQVDIYSQEILPKARQTMDLVATGYDAGEVGYLDLLNAQRTYFQTTLSYVDALRELWRAMLLIDGMLLDGSLQGIRDAFAPASSA